MSAHTLGSAARICHILDLDINLDAEAADVACAAGVDGQLFVALTSGQVLSFTWGSGAASAVGSNPCNRPAETPQRGPEWTLPADAGPPTALAAGNGAAGPFALLGTRNGWLLVLRAESAQPFPLSWPPEGREPAAITALLVGPAVETCDDGFFSEDKDASGPGVARRHACVSANVQGQLFRCWFSQQPAVGQGAESMAPLGQELCADLRSPILALELCRNAGKLLVSTAERIAIVDGALEPALPADATAGVMDTAAGGPAVRVVGTKPHKGQFLATFSHAFGRDRLVAARPGGRLWVADTQGTVQNTYRFQRPGSEDKASLHRLASFGPGDRYVASWLKSDLGEADAGASPSGSVLLLDLVAVSVCREWTLPLVVDIVRWGDACLLLAHRRRFSVLLCCESPAALVSSMLAGGEARLRKDVQYRTECLEQALELRAALEAQGAVGLPSAADTFARLHPLTEALLDVMESGDDTGCSSSPAEAAAITAYKRWVTDMESVLEAEDDMHSGERGVLANFPVAEGAHAVASPKIATARRHAHAAEVCNGSGAFRILEVAGPGGSKDGRLQLTPALLELCRQVTADSAAAVATIHVPITRQVSSPSKQALEPAPQALGVVQRALVAIPFWCNHEVLLFFSQLLHWLCHALDSTGEGIPVSLLAEETASAAAIAFELFCLHAGRTSAGAAQSAWPCLGIAPKGAVIEVEKEWACAVPDMAAALRAMIAALDESLKADAPGKSSAHWDCCGKHWTPKVAAAFCVKFLSSAPRTAKERCLFRANGLVASGAGWLGILSWLRDRPSAAAPRGLVELWAGFERSMLHRAFAFLGGEAPQSRSSTPTFGGFAAEGGIWAGGEDDRSGILPFRHIFEKALSEFPSILPWNVEACIRQALRSSPFAGHRGRAKRAFQACGGQAAAPRWVLAEHLAADFVQYLGKLLPTCQEWGGFAGLLDAALRMALHGHSGLPEPSPRRLHCGTNRLADDIIRRYRSAIDPDACRRLRYPMGVLRMLDVEDDEKEAALTDGDKLQRRLAAATSAVLQVLEGDQPAVPALARGQATVAVDRRHPATTTVSRTLRKHYVPQGDAVLANTLWELCEGDSALGHQLLTLVADRLPGQEANRLAGKPTAVEHLFAALVAVRPSPEAALACEEAVAKRGLSDIASRASVDALWDAAKGMGAVVNGDAGAAGALDSAAGTGAPNEASSPTWFALPPAPGVPALPSWPQRPPQMKSLVNYLPTRSLQKSNLEGFHVGLGDYVYVSSDGLSARHSDDSGEVMHGVVIGAQPLTPGPAGLYFEVELEEVRSEEMPDGLSLGVTATPPEAVQEIPATAEHVPQTWIVGYDGQMWDALDGTLSQVDWDPRSLQQGDVVGVLVTLSEGELLIFRNGVACCPGPRGIPVRDCQLYAVVDLLGAARSVKWRRDATMPVGS